MKLKIHQLIVWPEDFAHAARVIKFLTDKISVITGWSSTGKSSIVSIIDYVLGSGTCSIPVGEVRDLASWYGLVIEVETGMMIVAREKPARRQVSNDYWIDTYTPDGEFPKRPVSNKKLGDFKQLMDGMADLSDLRLSPEEDDTFAERASFRDMAAFNFLPQHIVANPYTLFFKGDSTDHKRKLANVLPLALGIITSNDLLLMHRVHVLRREVREAEQRVRARRAGLDTWLSNVTGAFYRAQELNLLPAGDAPSDMNRVIELLGQVVASGGVSIPGGGRVSGAVERLEEVRRQEREVDSRLSAARRRLRRLRSLRATVQDYDAVLAEQTARTHGVAWFKQAVGQDHCVLCGSETDSARKFLEELDRPLRELNELAAGTKEAAPVVDKEIVEIEAQLLADERRLIQLRELRAGFEAAADEERGLSKSLENVYRFIGSTEQALKMMGSLDDVDGHEERLRELKNQIVRLLGELDEDAQKTRREAIKKLLAGYITKFIQTLGIDGAEGTPEIDERELNLKFVHDGQRKPDFLWEIGSGENWMGYHLATLLALHGVFLKRRHESPVPTFIVIDQPSQVYFPGETFEDVLSEEASEREGRDRRGRRKLNDLERTKRIFAALARAQESFKGALQIIVLEHADQTAWGEHSNIAAVEVWRGDADFLISSAWLASA